MKKNLIALFLLISIFASAQKFEGLAPTPPMGWNSWNIFANDINEEKIKQIADLMVSSGMRDAGYTYLVLDDAWLDKKRNDKTGDLMADPKKFPNGMKAIGDYIHSKGLKYGIYNCAGTLTCQGFPGTRGYEYQDARYYASIGADYLKFDWCHTKGINAQEVYATMSNALKTAGRPMVFSICEWGLNKPWEWGKPIGHLWRTTDDIYKIFEGYDDNKIWKIGAMTILDMQVPIRKYNGVDGWNDPDMLEVGNGMTTSEDRAHFSMWCMLAAPLMAGNDLRKMTEETKNILTNKDVIAIDQDPLGFSAFRYYKEDSLEVWAKPLQNDDWAVCFLNRKNSAKNFTVNFKQAGAVTDTLSNKTFDANAHTYLLKDLWEKKEAGNTNKELKLSIPPHDVKMYRLVKQ